MNGGIAKVSRDGIPAVLRVNAFEVLHYLVKRFVPSDALPTVSSAADGIFEPIFIIVNVLQSHGLRADVASAEGVIFITADVQTLVGLNRDFDPTHSFAEIAVAVVRGAVAGGHHDGFCRELSIRKESHTKAQNAQIEIPCPPELFTHRRRDAK